MKVLWHRDMYVYVHLYVNVYVYVHVCMYITDWVSWFEMLCKPGTSTEYISLHGISLHGISLHGILKDAIKRIFAIVCMLHMYMIAHNTCIYCEYHYNKISRYIIDCNYTHTTHYTGLHCMARHDLISFCELKKREYRDGVKSEETR